MLVGRWLLPNRAPLGGLATRRDDVVYISELIVDGQSSAAGKRAVDVFAVLPNAPRAMAPAPAVHRHRRLANPSSPSSSESERPAPPNCSNWCATRTSSRWARRRTWCSRPGDILLVSGTPKEIDAVLKANGLQLATVLSDAERAPVNDLEQEVVEAVVLPNSLSNGRLVGDLGFGHLYGVSVMGVQRYGRQYSRHLRSMRLTNGDVLLLRGARSGLSALLRGQPAAGRRGRGAVDRAHAPQLAGAWPFCSVSCCWGRSPRSRSSRWRWPAPA